MQKIKQPLHAFLGIVLVVLLGTFGCVARSDVLRVEQAVLIVDGVEREVSLPHRLAKSDFDPEGSIITYRLTFDMPAASAGLQGIYISKLSLSGRLMQDGVPIWACGDEVLSELRCLHRPHLIQLPSGFLEPGRNTLAVEVFADSRQMNGLSAVMIGPYGELYHEHYLLKRFLKIDLVRTLSIFAGVAGLLSLAAGFAARRERVFLVFAAAAVFEAFSSFNLLAVDPAFDRPFASWLVFSIRFVAVLLKLLLFHVAFGRLNLRDPFLAYLLLLMIFGPAAFAATDSNRLIVIALYLLVLLGVLVTMVRVVRWTYKEPSKSNMFWAVAAILIFLSGLHDYLRLAGAATFEGIYVLNYVFPILIVLMGTMLFVRMGKGLRLTEDFAQALSGEVVQRTSELETALTSIRNLETSALRMTRNIPIGTFILQTWGRETERYAFFSDRLRKIMNLPPETEPPLFAQVADLLHPDDRAGACAALRKGIDDAARVEMEFRIGGTAGVWRWLRCIMLPQPDSVAPVVWDGVVIDVTEAREAEERVHLANASLVTTAAEQSRMAERDRLLQDMHDGFGSQLSSARLAIEQGRMDPHEVARILLECSEDLRIMVDALGNEEGNLAIAMADFRYRTERRLLGTGISTTWNVSIYEDLRMMPTTILQILRVLQEATNNALRHSGARQITLTIQAGNGWLTASVVDQGRGGAVAAKGGRGVANMRKRCRQIGAGLEISELEPGTKVALTMELPDAR